MLRDNHISYHLLFLLPIVQDCVPFGAAALLTFDTVTLTLMQGKGIAVPYCFGCLLYSMTPNVVKHEKKTLDYKGKVPPITRSIFAPTLYCKMGKKLVHFFH